MSYCTQNVPLPISLKAISPMFYFLVPLVPVWHKDIHIVIFCFFQSYSEDEEPTNDQAVQQTPGEKAHLQLRGEFCSSILQENLWGYR